MKNFLWKNKDLKCVVLCGGVGSRLHTFSSNKSKHMIDVAGKPILHHTIDYWREYTDQFIFLVHYKKKHIIDFVKTLPIKAEFVEDKLNGIADALKYAKNLLPENFIVVLGDCMTQGEFEFPKDAEQGVGVWQTDDENHIRVSFSVECDGPYIKRVVEKPKKIINNFCGMGYYFFNKKIFDYIEKTNPSSRGQIEITDVIQTMIDHGELIHHVPFKGNYVNINRIDDLEIVEKIFKFSE